MGNKIKTVSTGGGSATPVANDFNNFLQQGLNNGSYGAVGQTQGIGSVINGLLSGGNKTSGMGNFQDLMSRFSGNPNVTAPNVSAGGFSMPNTVSGINAGQGFDLSNIVSQIGTRNLLPSVNGDMPQAQSNVNTSGAQNTPEFDAISKILGNQFTKDLGDIRERYGVSSAGLNAESMYRANAIPQLNQALSQSALAQRQAGQTDVGLGMQGTGLNLQGAIAGLNSGVAQRGQNLDALATGRNQDIQTGQLGSSQMMQMIQNMLGQRGQDISQRGTDINSMLTGRGQDLSASQSNASNFLSGQGLLNNYLGTYGNLGLGAGQLNLAGNQLGQQGQLAALAQLFGGYQQANQLGTPQAQTQTYQQPSTFSQVMSGLSGLAGGIGGLATGLSGVGGWSGLLGSLFGGGGTSQVPMGNYGNLSIPGVSQMTPGMQMYTGGLVY